MTAGNHGSGTPENDDPFAYLYRSEGDAEGSGAAAQRPGVPRTSYNQVRAVGERRYAAGQQASHRQAQQASHQPASDAHYAAPETVPGGRAAARHNGHGGRGGRGAARNHNGLLIGALAVVAAVVIGVGAAMLFSDGGDDASSSQAAGSGAPARGAGGSGGAEEDGAQKGERKAELPGEDAAALRLLGGAQLAKDIPGAKARGGAYVTGFTTPGASATWTFDVPESGDYTLFVGYGVPGKDADSTLTVNGKPTSRPLNMKNFAMAEEGQWDKGWTRTYAYVDLNEGTNTVKISCEQGNQCEFVLDQVWLEKGQVSS